MDGACRVCFCQHSPVWDMNVRSLASERWNACVHRPDFSLYSYLSTRREQVTVFRLRTVHNRLNYHPYSKLCIGHTEQCPCGTGSQTEHLLQSCPIYEPLRKGIWPDHTPVARKLHRSLRGCDALPPSSRRLEFPCDEREGEEVYTHPGKFLVNGVRTHINSFLMVTENFWSWQELFCTSLVHVNAILNL